MEKDDQRLAPEGPFQLLIHGQSFHPYGITRSHGAVNQLARDHTVIASVF